MYFDEFPYAICGGQSGAGAGFSTFTSMPPPPPSISFHRCSIILKLILPVGQAGEIWDPSDRVLLLREMWECLTKVLPLLAV
jgi:hypothetical protein